jgi:hypothetical protein
MALPFPQSRFSQTGHRNVLNRYNFGDPHFLGRAIHPLSEKKFVEQEILDGMPGGILHLVIADPERLLCNEIGEIQNLLLFPSRERHHESYGFV